MSLYATWLFEAAWRYSIFPLGALASEHVRVDTNPEYPPELGSLRLAGRSVDEEKKQEKQYNTHLFQFKHNLLNNYRKIH